MAEQPRAGGEPLVDRGNEALRRGDWETARTRFKRRLALDDDSPEAWEGLGLACYWLQDAAPMFDARQQAYRRYRDRGDFRAAARIATLLASDFLEFRGEAAVGDGWLERARQLLEGREPSIEHAHLKEIEAHLALAVRRDAAAARAAAAAARDIARALGDVDHEMLAHAMEGMALVASGEIADGMRRLDAAAAAALGGDMADLSAISITCCYVIQACERVRDVERAAEWCARFHELCTRRRLGTFLTFCRIQHGTVLLWRGEWDEAEAELRAAEHDLERVRPATRAAAVVRLAELRRRQGRWDEAAALLEEARTHRLAPLWRAALALDRGDAVTTEELAGQVLRRNADSNDAEGVTALELLVRARATRGAIDEATRALAELESRAAAIGTVPVRAAALFAAGVLARARGDEAHARQVLRDAADLFEAGNSPFEAAGARLELAHALLAAGRTEPAEAQAAAALRLFERLGATRGADAARRFLQQGASVGGAARSASRLTDRQVEVLRLVAQGLGNREIGERLGLSEFTIRRHLANIYTRLGVSTRAAAVAATLRDGLL